MAVSSSQNFNLDIDEIIAEAYEHLGGPPFVGNDGITARRSLNLLLSDWQNRGILLWTTGFTNQALVSGTEQYELSDTIMAVTEAVSRRSSVDISMTRISSEEYLQIPDKTVTGRAIQFATIKGRDNITLFVWPTPENSTDIIRMHTVRRFFNFDKSIDDADVPYRFLPALSMGLAYYVGFKRMGITAERMLALKTEYENLLSNAMAEDRERAALLIKPSLRFT
jgi:hypothetical protein|tara:strand:+ start:36 stop:707 length:672 start_codon:yes stop_codon:yes gene_type:complete